MTDFLGLSSFILLGEGEWLWYILCNYFDVSLFPVLIYLQVKLLSLRLKPKVTMQNLVNCYAWIGESFLKHPILCCHVICFLLKEWRKRSCHSIDSGRIIFCRMTAFLRGAGGFSNSSQPFSYSKYQTIPVSVVKIPKSQPFAVFEDYTQPSQACSIKFHYCWNSKFFIFELLCWIDESMYNLILNIHVL